MMRSKILLLALIISAAAIPTVFGIEVHKGVIFHSVVNGGNITFAWDFNCTSITWSNNQVRFTDFTNGVTTWNRIGFRAIPATTMNITGVYDANMTVDVTVPGAGTDFEVYVFDKGEPDNVAGAVADTYAAGIVYFTMNAGGTVTITWGGGGATVYTIALGCVYDEVETNFNHLLIANCTDILGNSHNSSVTFVVDGVPFKWNNYMSRYEGTTKRTTAQTVTFDTLDSFNDLDDATATASIIQTCVGTWVSGSMDRMQNNMMDGDFIGMILNEFILESSSLFFYTTFMAIISIGIYNYAGVYVALFSWLTGWSVFSGLVHGQAQLIGILFIAFGLGFAVVKFAMDRRSS